MPGVSKLVGGVLGLTALAVCILMRIDPVTTTVRGLMAFAIGHVLGAAWEAISTRARVASMVSEAAEDHETAQAA